MPDRRYSYEYLLRDGRIVAIPYALHWLWRRLDPARRRIVERD